MSLISHFILFSCRSNFSDCIELDLKFPSPGSLQGLTTSGECEESLSRKLLAQYLTEGNSIIDVKIDFYI